MEDAGDLVDEVRLDELTGRQVHRHERFVASCRGIAPCARLATGRLEHPAAERQDQPRLLGQGDERNWWDQATDGMLPADEGLEPDDPFGREVDQRLVVQAELAALDRLA